MAQATISWTNSTTVGVTETIIYRDDIEIGRVPVADASVFFDTNTTPGATYKYEVQAVSPEGESIDEVQGVNVMDLTIPGTPTIGLRPILSNFTIENGQPNRVYFNSSKLIQVGINGDVGFIIEGKTITGVTINTGSTSGHYFTLSTSLNFWDNILIRYEGGSDMRDLDGALVYPFTLQYIQNNIEEPLASNDYYVATNGLDTNNGTSISTPWKTINKAAQTVTSGSTVWIKAGDYGSENVVMSNSGLVNSPIKFIGYKTSVGDAIQLNRQNLYDGVDSFDSTEMPLIKNGTGFAIDPNNKNYIIIRNIQIEGNFTYDRGIYVNNSQRLIIDNCYLTGITNTSIHALDQNSGFNRVINSYVSNSQKGGVELQGQHNLIKNHWSVSTFAVGMDYYITIYGGNAGKSSCVIDCYVNRYINDSHSGHGISFKGDQHGKGYELEYSLIENCDLINAKIELRHRPVKNNTVRNVNIEKDGIVIRDGASYNTLESMTVKNGEYFFRMFETDEDVEGEQTPNINPRYNKFINCIGTGMDHVIETSDLEVTMLPDIDYNSFLNCTFKNISNVWRNKVNTGSVKFNATNTFKNCIFENVGNAGIGGNNNFNATFEYSDVYNSYNFVGISTGSINIDPKLDINLKPTVDTPISVYEGGTSVGVEYDKDGVERITPYGMGAYEKNV